MMAAGEEEGKDWEVTTKMELEGELWLYVTLLCRSLGFLTSAMLVVHLLPDFSLIQTAWTSKKKKTL